MNQSNLLFQPELIIEVTDACNMSCKGCYAANIFINDSINLKNETINLSIDILKITWLFSQKIKSVAIRGGEPSLNPQICEIIQFLSQKAETVYFETNGLWIENNEQLLTVIAKHEIIVKLSLDKMHGSNAVKSKLMLNTLSLHNIKVAIAVTEPDYKTFLLVKEKYLGSYNGQVFWQKKASNIAEFYRPILGVINKFGQLKNTVTSKFKEPILASILLLILTFTLFNSHQSEASDKISIGLAANFSAMSDSTSNPYSNYFRNAVNMAFEENKKLLKAKGLDIELKEFDYSDDKIKVIETANNAVASNIFASIGYIYSSHVFLAGPIFNKNKLLLLTPTGTADRIEEIGPYVRRTCFDDSYQGKILANYTLKNKKIKNVGIISVSDCAYCQSLRNSFKQQFEAKGGKVTVDLEVLSNDTAFSQLSSLFKDKKVEAIFVPNYEKISATIISQLYDAGIRPKFWVGGDGWGNSLELFYRIIDKREFRAFAVSHWHPDSLNIKSKKFINDFFKKYGKQPIDTAVLAYDAASLLIHGLLNMKNNSKEGLFEAVEKIVKFQGVTGNMIFESGKRTPTKSAVLQIHNNGKFLVENFIGE